MSLQDLGTEAVKEHEAATAIPLPSTTPAQSGQETKRAYGGSTMAYPPIHADAKFVVLSDWDGTITLFDSNDHLIDNYGCGYERRRELNLEVLSGKNTFRDSFREELESIPFTFDKCTEILVKESKLDPGFADFLVWCRKNDVPVVIVSSGMEPLIRAVLVKLIGDELASGIDIISNGVKIEEDGKWHIQFRHPESGFGHDKSQAILPYRDLDRKPLLFFFGDGVSDLSAAAHADVLFAKTKPDGESDLVAYCNKLNIPHIKFTDFHQAQVVVEKIVQGELSASEALGVAR